MAKHFLADHAPTHVLFQTALAEGLPATYAHTLAECWFWFQKAQQLIDGRPAIYKTGRELSLKLGLAPRTINGHLKNLANRGYWRIEYRSRPHHPSPVTWLVISDRSIELVTNASSRHVRGTRSSTTGRTEALRSSEESCDVRTLKEDTTYRDTESQDSREERSFICESTDRRNEPSGFGSGRIRAPRYVGASEELESSVNGVSRILEELGFEPWDFVSRHAWEHCRELVENLHTFGYREAWTQIELVNQIVRGWPKLCSAMDYRYAQHSGNRQRPTPMALNHQLKTLLAALEDQSREIDRSTNPKSSLEGHFC